MQDFGFEARCVYLRLLVCVSPFVLVFYSERAFCEAKVIANSGAYQLLSSNSKNAKFLQHSHAKCKKGLVCVSLVCAIRSAVCVSPGRGFSFDFAWECCISQKKVAISLGSGDHDMHHSQLKC